MTTDEMLRIYKKTCLNRHFELEVAKAFDAKFIKSPIYLSIGTEHIPATLSEHCKDWLIFAQHRAHSYGLSFGMPPELLAKEILYGAGGSASFSYAPINMFPHSGLLGDQIPIAVGAAHASGRKTLAVMGDAAAEEDYVLAALGYAATKKAPVLFIVEDNNLSILTETKTRRSWNIVSVAKGFGLNAFHIRDSITSINHFANYAQLPALVNIECQRHRWHSGTGVDGLPKWNTFQDIRREIVKEIGINQVLKIELKIQEEMESLWQRLLKQ